MREPVALAIATRFRCVTPVHPAIEPVFTLAADRAARQPVEMIWVFAQAATSRAMAASDVISHHGQSS